MKLSSGVDIIEIERLREAIDRHGERFLNRVFTPVELAEVGGDPASLAVRFAAKEAVAKALGTGIGVICWQEIEVRRGPERQPQLHLHGAAAQLAQQLGLAHWSISLSHTREIAIAMAVGAAE
jgi:holo-[acyl-carrier protein] synthase